MTSNSAFSTGAGAAPGDKKADFWTADAYAHKVAPFVAKLTTRVVEMLDPKADDTILDLGCGDGELSAALRPKCRTLIGLDASANLLRSLRETYLGILAFELDCSSDLLPLVEANVSAGPATSTPETAKDVLHPSSYTAIFSNAALHWILRPPPSRKPFFAACFQLLKPGGRLVAEAGAAGNVAEVHAGLVYELVNGQGVPMEKVRAIDPWWFGGLDEYRALSEEAGFEWVRGEVELRQTKLTEGAEGGVAGWIRLFANPFAALLPGGADGEAWDGVVRRVAKSVEYVGRRADGRIEVNYVRVRFEVRKSTRSIHGAETTGGGKNQ